MTPEEQQVMMQDTPLIGGGGRSTQSPKGSEIEPRPVRRRPLVLIVEDDTNDLRMYGGALWYNGFDVIEARDGQSALDLAAEQAPDLVLVDLLLPGLTGIEVCRRLRQSGQEVPMIALTARSRHEFGDVVREAGCLAYLEKPIGPVEVLHVVEGVLGRPPPPGE